MPSLAVQFSDPQKMPTETDRRRRVDEGYDRSVKRIKELIRATDNNGHSKEDLQKENDRLDALALIEETIEPIVIYISLHSLSPKEEADLLLKVAHLYELDIRVLNKLNRQGTELEKKKDKLFGAIKEAALVDPYNWKAYNLFVEKCLRKNDLETLKNHLQKRIDATEKDEEYSMWVVYTSQLGDVNLLLGWYRNAATLFNDAADMLNSDCFVEKGLDKTKSEIMSDIHYGLAQVQYYGDKNPGVAIAQLESALKLNPQNFGASLMMAALCRANKDHVKASGYAKTAYDLNRDNKSAVYLYVWYLVGAGKNKIKSAKTLEPIVRRIANQRKKLDSLDWDCVKLFMAIASRKHFDDTYRILEKRIPSQDLKYLQSSGELTQSRLFGKLKLTI